MRNLSIVIIILCVSVSSFAQKVSVLESGIRKELRKEGKGDMPKVGQEVKVRFLGTLENGEVFDGNTFKFVVGDKDMLPAWNNIIQTMKVGEKSIFRVPPEMGYGEKGYTAEDGEELIPPNANLTFEMELLGIK